MTFLELQKKITQTRKARKGVKNKIDYYGEDFNKEDYESAVYRKALSGANQIVQHCLKTGKLEPFLVVWDKPQKEKERELEEKNLELLATAAQYEKNWKETYKQLSKSTDEVNALQEKVRELQRELNAVNRKLSRENAGRRTDYEKAAKVRAYKKEHPDESVRGIAKILGISPTTVQKVLTETRKL